MALISGSFSQSTVRARSDCLRALMKLPARPSRLVGWATIGLNLLVPLLISLNFCGDIDITELASPDTGQSQMPTPLRDVFGTRTPTPDKHSLERERYGSTLRRLNQLRMVSPIPD